MHNGPVVGITMWAAAPTQTMMLPAYCLTQTYVQAVRNAGGLPILLPPVWETADAEKVVARLDGLLLSGGGDIAATEYGEEDSTLLEDVDPARDQAELALARAVLKTGKPFLGICRGAQILNVATGGSLYADIVTQATGALAHRPEKDQPRDSSAHAVELLPGSQLAAIMGMERATVNSFHHQAARKIGTKLAISARAPDGIVEGLELAEHPFCVGVQWHPENKIGCQEGMERLFQALVQAARG